MLTLLTGPGSVVVNSTVELDPAEAHHGRVRRVAPGDGVRLVDGAGSVGDGEVVSVGDRISVRIDDAWQVPKPVPLVVAVGAGDRDRFGWLIEKATELGVTTVVPLETERTAGVATRLRDGHIDRMRRRALEALKQCGRAWALELAQPAAVADFLTVVDEGERWVARQGAAAAPGNLDPATPVTVAVGPEGGFTDDEIALLQHHEFVPVALGPHVLRFETAAVAAAAAVAALRGT